MKKQRRSVLKSIASVSVGSTIFSGISGASSVRQTKHVEKELGEHVGVGKAKKVAKNARLRYSKRSGYDSWSSASIGQPTTYYTTLSINTKTRYIPSAYVFPVEHNSEYKGYVTVSARKIWSPVLEASTSSPPSAETELVDRVARENGTNRTGRLLYNGSVTYSVELEDSTLVNLGSGIRESISTEAPKLAFEKHPELVEPQWSNENEITTQSVTTQSTEKAISGVPAWDANGGSGTYSGSDSGNADTSAPDCFGDTADPWDEWDGCAPFAAAQVLMYHENISLSDIEEREEIVDRLHKLMGTNSEGWTGYLDPQKGFTDYPTSETTYDYTGYEETVLSKDLFRSEVEAIRPFLVNMPNNDLEIGGDAYSGHTVTAYGYYEDSNSFEVIHHNSWDEDEHWMAYGNWPVNTWVTRCLL